MKALTLYQPWAWLIEHRFKEVETRDWHTSYRGPLAIHAAMKHDVDGKMLHLHLNNFRGLGHILPEWIDLTFGAVVATCNLVVCIPTGSAQYPYRPSHRDVALNSFHFTPENGWDFEEHFGNYAPGRFAWILRDIEPVTPPIPCHGWQRLWNLDAATIHELQGRAT